MRPAKAGARVAMRPYEALVIVTRVMRTIAIPGNLPIKMLSGPFQLTKIPKRPSLPDISVMLRRASVPVKPTRLSLYVTGGGSNRAPAPKTVYADPD
ncbi:MAG: hypothetical protein COB53_01510 [Elusimicrobia bacterium]|nr:MAG: hypothetical protein COB53_01510 [Elusimicrobiota bacterium]